ncbi:uncharacterized protein YALI1_A18671g [Yarrowia lipolytica]|uniref:Uncharacterized protein n=1 Tax=Yarrowia lipolytica TaxID=4952 RepID=A0A1D8N5A9_YARLL|nr:hypothetical protein YALI1_A18671g [Yarrowia lipolytica]
MIYRESIESQSRVQSRSQSRLTNTLFNSRCLNELVNSLRSFMRRRRTLVACFSRELIPLALHQRRLPRPVMVAKQCIYKPHILMSV